MSEAQKNFLPAQQTNVARRSFEGALLATIVSLPRLISRRLRTRAPWTTNSKTSSRGFAPQAIC